MVLCCKFGRRWLQHVTLSSKYVPVTYEIGTIRSLIIPLKKQPLSEWRQIPSPLQPFPTLVLNPCRYTLLSDTFGSKTWSWGGYCRYNRFKHSSIWWRHWGVNQHNAALKMSRKRTRQIESIFSKDPLRMKSAVLYGFSATLEKVCETIPVPFCIVQVDVSYVPRTTHS